MKILVTGVDRPLDAQQRSFGIPDAIVIPLDEPPPTYDIMLKVELPALAEVMNLELCHAPTHPRVTLTLAWYRDHHGKPYPVYWCPPAFEIKKVLARYYRAFKQKRRT